MGAYFSLLVLSGTPAEADATVAAWLDASEWEEIEEEEGQEGEEMMGTCTTFRAGQDAVGIAGDPVPLADPERLRETTTEVSSHADDLVVGIDVEDSDVLTLVVADAGTAHQVVRVGPAVETPVSTPDRIWTRVLDTEHSLDDLAAAWAAPATYAEDALDRTCALCGWAGDRLQPHVESTPPVVTKRHVRLTSPDTDEESGKEETQLGHIGGDHGVTASVGDDARFRVVAHSIAGKGAKLTVIARGSALDDELLDPQTVGLTVGHPATPRVHTSAPLRDNGNDDGRRVSAQFDSTIPPGFETPAAAMRGVSATEGVRRWLKTRIEAAVSAKAVQSGTGVLTVDLIPDDADAVTWSVDVNVVD